MSSESYKGAEEIEHEIEHTRSEMRRTLDTIQNRFIPGQMVEDVMTYFRQGPGEFASNFGRVVRDNPFPIALIGTGLAWLAMSGARHRSQYDDSEYDYDYERSYYAGAGGGDYVAAAGAENAAYTASGTYYGSSQSSYGQEGGMAGGPGSFHHDEGQPGRINRLTGGAREQMSRIGGLAREQGGRARGAINDMVDERPFVMGAAAFVLGAALGAMLPTTRREDEMLGEVRDDLAHRASEMGRKGAERAQHAAQETWTSVTDEMLNPEGSGASETAGNAERTSGGTGTARTSGSQAQGTSSARGPASTAGASTGASASASSNVKPGGAAGTTPGGGATGGGERKS